MNLHVIVPADAAHGKLLRTRMDTRRRTRHRRPGPRTHRPQVPNPGAPQILAVDRTVTEERTSATRSTFRRMLTGPATGVLTDLAERRYRPSVALDRAVRSARVTCRFPGCRRSADQPRHRPRPHHPLARGPNGHRQPRRPLPPPPPPQTQPRLEPSPFDPTGTMTWTTPTGHTITTHPWQYTDPHPPDEDGPPLRR